MSETQSSLFQPAKTKRASEVIYDQIYQKIVTGELKHGDRLPSERELADQFHRGRQSVREALRMLQQEGLLQISLGNNGGAYIQRLSLANAKEPLQKLIDTGIISYKELVDFRYFSDLSSMELAYQYRTEEDLISLHEILERFHLAVHDRIQFPIIDVEFHRALAYASHNQLCIIISETVSTLGAKAFWEQTAALSDEEIFALNEQAYELHASFLEAFEKKDHSSMMKYAKQMQTVFSSGTLHNTSD